MSVVNRYYVKNPEFVKIKEILQKHINDYNIKFECLQILCEGELHFPYEHITNVKSLNIKTIRCYYLVDKTFRLMNGSDLLEYYY